MIVVLGQTRTGTSLAMQLLNAAGASCEGAWQIFESERFRVPPYPFEVLEGAEPEAAVKIIPVKPRTLRLPAHARVILTTRNVRERNRSEIKFGRFFGIPWQDTREVRRRLKRDVLAEQRALEVAARPCAGVLRWPFERVILDPYTAAAELVDWLGFGDPERVAACVLWRRPGCYPGMLEIDVMRGRETA